ELAVALETTPDDIKNTLSLRGRKVSMDAPMGSDSDSGSLLDVMIDEASIEPDSDLMTLSMQKEIQRALSTLSERESQVLSMYYGLSGGHALSLNDIGEQFDLTRERVRQIKEKATKKLRKGSRVDSLKAYLG
ncbi:MAG: sigma-70 family RNA polymerase sigma factor, partial [Cyclobacteriaceae bacterium]|nr:sigma-70 family RNA polymerase sigma factor [Cyclobacteriaceae bacterium]